MLPGWHSCIDLHSLGVPRGQESSCCPVPSRPLPVLGATQDCVLCRLGAFRSRALCCWNRAPRAVAPEGIRVQTTQADAPCLTHQLLFHVSCWLRSSPLVRSAHSLWRAFPRCTSSVGDSEILEAPLPLLKFHPSSWLSTFQSGKNTVRIFKVPASPGLGFPFPEALAARP